MRTALPFDRRRPLARMPRLPAVLFGALVLAGLLPGGVQGATATTTAAPASPGVRPTVQYEEALVHAGDRIAFTPGTRVTVPFTPRTSDRWTVDGAAPRSLPSGRVSGQSMRTASSAVPGPPTDALAPVSLGDDRPVLDPSRVIAAETASLAGGSDPSTFHPAAAVDPGGLRREVFGFLPYWELSDSSTRLDWEKISTVAYFGVGADGTGFLQKKAANGSPTVGWSGWTSSRMTNVINAAHASGARVVLTVQSFAWTSSGLARQKQLLGSPTYRLRLARQIAAAVRDRGADGVNLDFEPIASGYSDEFTSLVRAVRAQLNHVAKGYQLTFDATGWIGNYPIRDATAKGAADAVVVMGYDYRSSGSKTVGSLAPLGGPGYDIGDTVAAYVARIPASKVILGVPYYGRAWSTPTSSLHATNISGTKYGASVAIPYTTAREFALQYGRTYDRVEAVSWIAYRRRNCTSKYGCVTPWRQLYYDDVTALKAKYDLVNRAGLRGVGIWALGYDGKRPELYAALKAKFITDRVPPTITAARISAARFSPDGNGHADTVTMRLTATALVRWGYSVAPISGGRVGKAIRGGSRAGKTPSFTWDGSGAGGKVVRDGRYRITLWAADASDNRSRRSFDVVVDRTRATVTPSVRPAFLTPGVAGANARILIGWTSTEALTGTVSLLDPAGAAVRRWAITSKARWTTGWTGTRPGGALVRDGAYTLRVDGFDTAGNRTVRTATVLVDRTIRSASWSAASFDPRGGATSQATVGLLRAARLQVAVYHGTTLVRPLLNTRAVDRGTHRWTWDGKTAAGSWAAPGTYRLVVRATSRFGTTEVARTIVVRPH